MKNKQLLIETMLAHDLDFSLKCLLLIYDRQTLDEQQVEQSIHRNQRGFNSSDAHVLSNIGEAIRHGTRLTREDEAVVLARMPKYAKQLVPLIDDGELIS